MTGGDPQGRRTALVTGGTGGIGRAVALRLAARGDRVLVTGRDPQRGSETVALLRAANPDAAHLFLPADLSLLSETARLAAAVTRQGNGLDALVCCAGVLSTRPEYTAEGLERTLVVNYLSRYLLARHLQPFLAASQSGRLVLVANAGRYRDTIDLDDLQHRRGRPGLAVSGRTQFANDLLAIELAERWRGTRIQVTCVFPGVARTDVFSNAVGMRPAIRAIANGVSRLVGTTPHHAAMTPAFLASDPQAADTGGRFYGPDLRELRIPSRAMRRDRRVGLWEASERLVRPYLTPPEERDAPDRGSLQAQPEERAR